MSSPLSSEAKDFLIANKEKKVVFTNGCFDILHVGHVKYLHEAKSYGDLLFIGLNSDSSIRKIKGDSRPINNESNRKYLLESLRCVDWVEVFYQETPYELIKAVAPNILVKGGDWRKENIVGFDLVEANGGIVKLACYQTGYSTTNLIDRITKCTN